jgi:hypothetical protein
MRTSPGYRPFWPELEPTRQQRYGWCGSCRARTLPGHGTTRRHRRATRPIDYAKGSGDWLNRRYILRDPDEQYDDAV